MTADVLLNFGVFLVAAATGVGTEKTCVGIGAENSRVMTSNQDMSLFIKQVGLVVVFFSFIYSSAGYPIRHSSGGEECAASIPFPLLPFN